MMKTTKIVLLSMATATLLNATGGGILDYSERKLSASQKIASYRERLKKCQTEFEKDVAYIRSNKINANRYLTLLKNTNVYLENNYRESASCMTQENELKMNPPKYEEILQLRKENIAKCYARANASLEDRGDIVATLKETYKEMKLIEARSIAKGLNVKSLSVSITTLKSLIAANLNQQGEHHASK